MDGEDSDDDEEIPLEEQLMVFTTVLGGRGSTPESRQLSKIADEERRRRARQHLKSTMEVGVGPKKPASKWIGGIVGQAEPIERSVRRL